MTAVRSYQSMANDPYAGYRQRALTLDTTATPFGCCNFFDRCTDELMSLHFSGMLPLLDWMGFNVTDECYQVMEFIAWARPEYSGGNPTGGYISDPCADPNGIEYGSTKISVEGYGRYGRKGPTREIMKPTRYCATDPVRRLDGQVVTSESEWDLRFAVDQLLVDVQKHVITGNATTNGQFDGLERWVRNGYTGPNAEMLDATVIDWNGNPMAGGAGITWNGAAIAATWAFMDVLLSTFRRLKQRISWARQLANQQWRLGDAVLVMPTFLTYCLLDYFTCWSVCDGGLYSPVNLQQMESRAFRDGLISSRPENMFGFGYITLDGVAIPLMAYDYELIKGPKTGDIYFLTRGIGGVDIWEGQHLSAASAASEYGDHGYFTVDAGRILGKVDTENECTTLKAWMHPRLFCRAPWAQVRFQNVQCEVVGGPLSPDPEDTSFFPLTSFSVAEC